MKKTLMELFTLKTTAVADPGAGQKVITPSFRAGAGITAAIPDGNG